jgi:hypothetical protein
VLRECGVDDAEIRQLADRGAIQAV